MKSIMILRYILFIPAFLLTFVILGNILPPILSFLGGLVDFIYASRNDGGISLIDLLYLDKFITRAAVSFASLSVGYLVYPGKNLKIPTIINSIILLTLVGLMFYFAYASYSFVETLPEIDQEEIMEGISILRFIMELLGTIGGIFLFVKFMVDEDWVK